MNILRSIFFANFCIFFLILPKISFAVTYKDNDFTATFDSTLSFGTTFRISPRESDLIGIANGGTAPSVNGDDGNLNYDRGLTAAAFKATHEINIDKNQEFGSFIRFTYFYDLHNAHKKELSDTAQNRVGRDIELLDAYQYLNGRTPWDQAFSMKIGNQAMNWGESSFIRNGINSFNPVSASKIRIPGSEVRDALLPFAALDLNFGLTDNLSVEGFYQFFWEETEPDAAGTFFSINDFASPGGRRVFLGFGSTNNPANSIKRGNNREPRHHNQFGFALRYYAEWLNQTEFGLYYTDYHSRLPLVSANIGSSAATIVPDSSYFLDFPEHIKVYGASFNTELSTLGLSWQGEASYKKDHPLQIHSIELLQAGFSPATLGGLLLGGTPLPVAEAALSTNQVLRDLGINNMAGINSLLGSEVKGYRRFDIVTAQTTLAKVFSPILKSDQFIFAAEAGFNYVTNMPSKSKLRLDAPATYLGGNSVLAGPEGVQASKTFPTAFSWGYVLSGRLDYLNSWGGINFYPKLSFRHDVKGITPNPLATFREHQKSISIGLEGSWQNKWEFELQYTNYFGGGRHHLLRDRDHASAEIKYSF